MTAAMEPADVGRVARAWDEQHLDLVAACRQVAGAPLEGFSAEVSPAAAVFVERWRRHTDEVAAGAEARADALRDAIGRWIETDDHSAVEIAVAAAWSVEQR